MTKWILLSGVILFISLAASVHGPPDSLLPKDSQVSKFQYVDRMGVPLSRTFENSWNLYERVSLEKTPNFLKEAFIISEDKRFLSHIGFDPLAILHAFASNIKAFRIIRGASTLSEQVIRMLHPRKRTFRNRLLEIIEATLLETKFSKDDILEFYLNQVPFGGKIRGVKSAALSLFDRDISTLSKKESLSLAVQVRAPSEFSPKTPRGKKLLEKRILELAERMRLKGLINNNELEEIKSSPINVSKNSLLVDASHFIGHIEKLPVKTFGDKPIRTTIKSSVQNTAKELLKARIKDLSPYAVKNGGILVIDNRSMEVLAWVNASSEKSGTESIDSITTLRQPGSTLKPFLYAKALEKGWDASTLIEDSPLLRGVGAGLKEYRNFSRTYYGPVRLRIALGNSLNIPAVRTIEFVGRGDFFSLLKELGFNSLGKDPDFYGDGLALGNGEVSLYELVRAYSTLANGGIKREPKFFLDEKHPSSFKRIIRKDVSSLIGDILSDPDARALEFGRGGLFAFPSETAIKTGTSSDFHDAWAIGYSSRYTVGVWLGNLNREPMREISGARGAVLLLRSIFSFLDRYNSSPPLFRDPSLKRKAICDDPEKECSAIEELFLTRKEENLEKEKSILNCKASFETPTQGLNIADDPRIPDSLEALPLKLSNSIKPVLTNWYVDEKLLETTQNGVQKTMWKLIPGRHVAKAKVNIEGCAEESWTNDVAFYVK